MAEHVGSDTPGNTGFPDDAPENVVVKILHQGPVLRGEEEERLGRTTRCASMAVTVASSNGTIRCTDAHHEIGGYFL